MHASTNGRPLRAFCSQGAAGMLENGDCWWISIDPNGAMTDDMQGPWKADANR